MKGVGCGAGRMTWRIAWMMGIFLSGAGCATTTPSRPTPHFLAWSQERATPKRLCILPFLDRTHTPGLATQVRQSVAGHLSVKHFSDVELSNVDVRLTTLGKEWRNFAPQQIGQTVGCDALLYGEVTDAGRLYLALYSQLTVAATIRLVDVTTGQTLVHESYATKFREASVPLSPLSVVPDVIKTWMNLSETQMARAIDDLARNLAARVPDLPLVPPPLSGQSVIVATPPALPPLAATPGNQENPPPGASSSQPLTPVVVAALNVPTFAANTGETRPSSLPSRSATQGHYRLQVAAFRTYDDAQWVVRLLRDNGYPAMMTQTGIAEKMWNQVVLGPFPSRAAALRVGRAIRKIAPLSPEVIPRLGR